VSNAVREGESI